jgi:hypothetical protein
MENNNKNKARYSNAPIIKCACGCGEDIPSLDAHGYPKTYVNGHDRPETPSEKTRASREWNKNNKEKRYLNKVKYIRTLKAQIIESKNSSCNSCGIKYNGKNAAIFDLHHEDPEDKDFNLSLGALNRISKARALKEAEKCLLLCANCHRLEHSEEY